MGCILEQLQQGVGAHQHTAAARQAGKLAGQQGGDVSVLLEQLQAIQVGRSNDASSGGGSSAAAAAGTPLEGALPDALFSSATASSAGGVLPVTRADITVAANALLVACIAAGALLGVPQLLEQSARTALPEHQEVLLQGYKSERESMCVAQHDVAEWAVLLHPLLVQLLPAQQGQVLVDLQGRLAGTSSSGSNDGSNSPGDRTSQYQGGAAGGSKLSDAEVEAVLGALQHVVVPGQPGCSNPRCCCLEGVSKAAMKTQVCKACRGARYCSAICQRAHWRAGHKEVCKAVQAAAKAASNLQPALQP